MQFISTSLPLVPSVTNNTAYITLARIIGAVTAGDDAYCLCCRRILGRYLVTRSDIYRDLSTSLPTPKSAGRGKSSASRL